MFLALGPGGAAAAPDTTRRQEMSAVYAAFKDMQPALARESLSNLAGEDNRLLQNLQVIRDGLHSFGGAMTGARSPGFESSLSIARELVTDAINRIREGNRAVARRELKGLSSLCIACHSTNNMHLSFADQIPELSHLTHFEKGEYFFATRQFKRAELAYMAAFDDQGEDALPALRRWLVVMLRAEASPSGALVRLDQIVVAKKLSVEVSGEIGAWRATLAQIVAEKSSPDGYTFDRARSEIAGAISRDLSTLDVRVDPVRLLVASAALHTGFERGDINGENRAEALYLLGLSYSRLDQFLSDNLPVIFLRQCIDEFPGTPQAQSSYRVYEMMMKRWYPVKFPDDVKLTLSELYARAHNIPRVPERL
jgi:hypothetical protein